MVLPAPWRLDAALRHIKPRQASSTTRSNEAKSKSLLQQHSSAKKPVQLSYSPSPIYRTTSCRNTRCSTLTDSCIRGISDSLVEASENHMSRLMAYSPHVAIIFGQIRPLPPALAPPSSDHKLDEFRHPFEMYCSLGAPYHRYLACPSHYFCHLAGNQCSFECAKA
jgi:hypothetical protein